MIFVTTSRNDNAFYTGLVKSLPELVVRAPLPCGDVVFYGVWEEGRPISVCVERKHLGDLIACMLSGRYLAQAQNAKESGFDFLYLVAEGEWYPGTSGEVMVYRRGGVAAFYPPTEYRRLEAFLEELDIHVGVQVRRTRSLRHTVAKTISLYLLFQKPPEEHHSLDKIFVSTIPKSALLFKPSLLRRIAKELPGIGWERSSAVDAYFSSVTEMVSAPVPEWRKVKGIGKTIAENVVGELTRRRDGHYNQNSMGDLRAGLPLITRGASFSPSEKKNAPRPS